MLKKLFEGVDGVSADLVEKLEPMFEAAVETKVQKKLAEQDEKHQEEISELREQLAESAASNHTENMTKLAEGLDNFLEMAVSEWANQNSEKLQNVALNESASVFLSTIAQTASQFNTVIPESDKDIVEDLRLKLEEAEARADDALTEAAKSRSDLVAIKKRQIVEAATVGMTDLGAERLRNISESVMFSNEKIFKQLIESHKLIIEKCVDEDDAFDDGKVKKSKQGKDGKMVDEEFVDGTDKDYPLNIKEGDDDDDEEDPLKEGDEEDEEDEGKKKDSMNESVDMSLFSKLMRPRR